MSDVIARNRRENASTRSTRGSSNCSPVARSRERNLSASGEARKSSSFTRELVGGIIMTRKRYFAMEFLCEPPTTLCTLSFFRRLHTCYGGHFWADPRSFMAKRSHAIVQPNSLLLWSFATFELAAQKFRCKMALQNRRVGLSEMRQDARENAAS